METLPSEDGIKGKIKVTSSMGSENATEDTDTEEIKPQSTQLSFQEAFNREIAAMKGSHWNIKKISSRKTSVKPTQDALVVVDLLLKHEQEKWNEYKNAIQMFPYFNGWSEEVIKEGCNLTKIESYTTNQTILGDGKGERNFVYFILKGQCQMVQSLNIAISERNGRKRFRLLPQDHDHLEIYFMQVCLMDKGECFGIGENLKKRSIVALTSVKCLLCPRHWLQHNSQANIWERIKQFLNRQLPTNEDLFREFVDQRMWQDYKIKVVKDITDKKVTNTSMHDVPYSIRITQRKEAYS